MKKTILLTLLIGLSLPTVAKQLYRYKNSEGNIIVQDQVTNAMIAAGYEILSDKGSLVKKVPPAKTLAEEEEERLKLIDKKKEQYKLQLKIRSDAELLRQFSSIGHIIRNRDAQLLGLEQRIKIQGSKSNLLKLQLEDLQKDAATHERLGRKIPKLLQGDIEATHQQITKNQQSVVQLEDEKVTVAKRFEGDIVRYKKLESLRKNLKKTTEKNDGSSPVIYDCPNVKTCQKAWQLAQLYAKDNASGQIEIITNALILTSKPEKDDELAISFSKIPAPDDNSQIVLEVSCNDTEGGVALCKSDVVKNKRIGYLELIEKQLN